MDTEHNFIFDMIKEPKTGFEALNEHLRETYYIQLTSGLLGWDQQVNLPEGGHEQRGHQLAALAKVLHARRTDPVLGKILEELNGRLDSFSDDEKVVVKRAQRDFERAVALPEAHVRKVTFTQAGAFRAWCEAREKNDPEDYYAWLEELLALAREESALQGYEEGRAYDLWLDKYDEGLTEETVAETFGPLRKELTGLAQEVYERDRDLPKLELGVFDEAKQEQFAREVIERMGLSWKHTRLDRAPHPFCSGNGLDLRLTTRYEPGKPLESLYASIHEAGHGLYVAGLDSKHYHNALGTDMGMAVHESQSRLWENQVGRSDAFWTYWEERYRELFADEMHGVSSEAWLRYVRRVDRSPLRVYSDEMFYNLHIILRFELERRLFRGELKVRDLPEAWSELSAEILGFRPQGHKEGLLQDVHWAYGAFGYFPSYALGNIIGAQLWEKRLEECPDTLEQIGRGEMSDLGDWLKTRVYDRGKRTLTAEFVKEVTGESLNSGPLLRYLKGRYGI